MKKLALIWRPLATVLLLCAFQAPSFSQSSGIAMAKETSQEAVTESEGSLDPVIGPRADLVLRAMGKYMKSAKQFSFRGKISFDDLLPSEQKIQYSAVMQVAIKRPDRAYAESNGDLGGKRFWYDGKTATLLDTSLGLFATVDDAPDKLEGLMEHLMEKYDFVPPLADFAYPDFYEALIENVQQGFYVGLHDVEGVRCHHLAFVAKYIDWQIWVEDGVQMVPRKILITYKTQPGSPQYTAVLEDWNLNAPLPDVLFEVKEAFLANFEKIDFLPEVDLKIGQSGEEADHETKK